MKPSGGSWGGHLTRLQLLKWNSRAQGCWKSEHLHYSQSHRGRRGVRPAINPTLLLFFHKTPVHKRNIVCITANFTANVKSTRISVYQLLRGYNQTSMRGPLSSPHPYCSPLPSRLASKPGPHEWCLWTLLDAGDTAFPLELSLVASVCPPWGNPYFSSFFWEGIFFCGILFGLSFFRWICSRAFVGGDLDLWAQLLLPQFLVNGAPLFTNHSCFLCSSLITALNLLILLCLPNLTTLHIFLFSL